MQELQWPTFDQLMPKTLSIKGMPPLIGDYPKQAKENL